MSLPVTSARAMLEGFQLLGLDVARIRARAGLRDDQLVSSVTHLPDSLFAGLWQNAFEEAGRDTLAVEVAMALPVGSFGIVDYLTASAPSVGEAIEALQFHFGHVAGEMALEVETGQSGVTWIRLQNARIFEGREVSDEFTLAMILARIRSLAASPVDVVRVELSRRNVSHPERWSQLWGATLRFGRPVPGICLSSSAWKTRSKKADPRLEELLRGLSSEAATFRTSFLTAAKASARRLLQTSKPSLPRLARELNLSVRSLQRRLSEVSTPYRQLLDSVRKEEAIRLVQDCELPLREVAFRLGFDEQSSFSRAFHRWTGERPTALRARERAQLSADFAARS